jgi:6-phosphogluconolactonase
VLQYRFDARTGELTPNEPASLAIRSKAGPRHFVFHPNGDRVYLLNELDGTIDNLRYDPSSGRLSHEETRSILPDGFESKPWAADIRVTPDGRFLYASERRSSMLAIIALDAAGAMALAGHVATEQQPRAIAIDSSGRYLLCAGERSNALAVYAIDPARGALAAADARPVGATPNWIETTPAP